MRVRWEVRRSSAGVSVRSARGGAERMHRRGRRGARVRWEVEQGGCVGEDGGALLPPPLLCSLLFRRRHALLHRASALPFSPSSALPSSPLLLRTDNREGRTMSSTTPSPCSVVPQQAPLPPLLCFPAPLSPSRTPSAAAVDCPSWLAAPGITALPCYAGAMHFRLALLAFSLPSPSLSPTLCSLFFSL